MPRFDVGPPAEPPTDLEVEPAANGADPEAVARAIALRRLSHAPQTRAQLEQAMHRRAVPEDVMRHVLDRFTEVGLIDDAAFAAAWVESRHAGRGLARRALAHELRQRGVQAEIVDEAVGELEPEQEFVMAKALVAARLPATRGLDPVKRTRRLVGMLARKGYSGGVAFRAVREALEEEGAAGSALPDEDL